MKISRILAFFIFLIVTLSTKTAFAQVPDPGTPGPLAVTREEYNFGDTAFQPTDFPGPVEFSHGFTQMDPCNPWLNFTNLNRV